MKLKYDFAVREIVGEYVMIPLGKDALNFSGMVSTSETGAAIIEALRDDISREELLQILLDQFDIDEATASVDLDEFLTQLRKINVLDE